MNGQMNLYWDTHFLRSQPPILDAASVFVSCYIDSVYLLHTAIVFLKLV
jgi:hypothetical protein